MLFKTGTKLYSRYGDGQSRKSIPMNISMWSNGSTLDRSILAMKVPTSRNNIRRELA